MIRVLRQDNGMNIVGQGGKIILFTLPALAGAMLVHAYAPEIAALPEGLRFLRPLGYLLLPVGVLLWAVAIVQLLTGFSHGRLVTTGAYGIVRNPIYASVTFFVLPAVSLLSWTWVYFVAAAFLYLGVMRYIGPEERQLGAVFGHEYEDYMSRVDRLVPFKRP